MNSTQPAEATSPAPAAEQGAASGYQSNVSRLAGRVWKSLTWHSRNKPKPKAWFGKTLDLTRAQILELLSSTDTKARLRGVFVSVEHGHRDRVITNRVLELMSDETCTVRMCAAAAIYRLRIKRGLPLAIRGLSDPAPNVRAQCAWALYHYLGKRSAHHLIGIALHDESPTVAYGACEMLVRLGHDSVMDRIEALDELPEVRRFLQFRAEFQFPGPA